MIGDRPDVPESLRVGLGDATSRLMAQNPRSHRFDRVQSDGKTELTKRKPLTCVPLELVRKGKCVKASGRVRQHTVKRVADLATIMDRETNDRRKIKKHATDAKGVRGGP